jgi:dipeptidyl aminopeptidase/acylaminoacyl peptidase
MTTIAPYGSWKSPITPDLILAGAVGLGQIALDGDDVYWVEQRPSEAGRNVVVKWTGGAASDVNPAPLNARTRVHEYGGGAYLVDRGVAHYSNFADQRLYRQRPGEAVPQPITPEGPLRYADGVIDHARNRMICVREDSTFSAQYPTNALVSINLEGDAAAETAGGQVLAAGNDFYASPRLSPDGAQLAWLTWNHPNMPWDGCELWVGELNADGSIGVAERIAGSVDESIFQPEGSPDGELHFVSDRTGWWNLYRQRDGQIEALCPLEAEFGLSQWVFGLSTYAFESAQRIICAYTLRGEWKLAALDTATGQLDPFDLSYTQVGNVRAAPGCAVFIAASPTEPPCVVRLDLASNHAEVLRRSSEVRIDAGYMSVPQAIEFPTENGLTAHAFYYPPVNQDFESPIAELPPLLVHSHGGPTSATSSVLNWGTQYWTSRGFAVLDVNYGGSTGYGTAYRRRLYGQWGIVDVDDCCNGARYLVERGLVDEARLAIAGGSAGGYTTLCALAFRNIFKAGANHFGLSELEAFVNDTHKFESRYLYTLVGPYPERRDLYYARSPINFAHQIACPVIVLQGLEDKIVPPNQSEMIYDAVRARGLPTAYLAFEGEQHGFRKAENIKRALEAELYFYSRVFYFELAEPIEPVKIENL